MTANIAQQQVKALIEFLNFIYYFGNSKNNQNPIFKRIKSSSKMWSAVYEIMLWNYLTGPFGGAFLRTPAQNRSSQNCHQQNAVNPINGRKLRKPERALIHPGILPESII